jgi:hypothetical protein
MDGSYSNQALIPDLRDIRITWHPECFVYTFAAANSFQIFKNSCFIINAQIILRLCIYLKYRKNGIFKNVAHYMYDHNERSTQSPPHLDCYVTMLCAAMK